MTDGQDENNMSRPEMRRHKYILKAFTNYHFFYFRLSKEMTYKSLRLGRWTVVEKLLKCGKKSINRFITYTCNREC